MSTTKDQVADMFVNFVMMAMMIAEGKFLDVEGGAERERVSALHAWMVKRDTGWSSVF